MQITPHQLDLWSSNMASLYNSLEGEIIRIIAKRLNNGHDNILDWQTQALRDLHLFNDEVTKMLSDVTGVAESQIKAMFEETGHTIVTDIDGYMIQEPLPLPTNLDNIMKAYFEQSWSSIDNLVNQTLISTNYGYTGTATQAYTQTYNRIQALLNTGIYTFDEAVEKAIQELAQSGVKSTFVDKGGHTWSLERYTRTVLKSTLNNTYDTLRKDRMAEYGVHTVVVTSHMGARLACSRIQGNVVDLRENVPIDSKYKSIYDSFWSADYGSAGGHRGVNCNHLHFPFIPGVNTNNQPKIDSEENAEVRKLTDKQRQLERAIVKMKKNKMVAEELGHTENAKKYGSKIWNYQKQLRDLIGSNKYLSRNYKNEKVYTPLSTLLKDFRYDNFADNATIRATINSEKFNRHVKGTKEYADYVKRGTKTGGQPSYLTISKTKAQKLLDEYLTNEMLGRQRNKIDFNEKIGYWVNQKTGEKESTSTGIVHISKTGIHIVPTMSKRK